MTLIERETKSLAEKRSASLRQAVVDVQRFLVVATSLQNHSSFPSHEILGHVEAAKAIQAEEAKLRKLIDRLAKPATLEEIAKAVVMLLEYYPGRDNWNAAAWAHGLREDIAELEPSLFQLERAMKEARQTFKFPPTIAEVLPLFKNKCLASFAARKPPLADLIEEASRSAASRRELEAMPRHTPAIAKPAKALMAPRTLAECAAMCSVPEFDPSFPEPELNESERKSVKQIASELMAGTYNRLSPLRFRVAALHLVHEQLRGG